MRLIRAIATKDPATIGYIAAWRALGLVPSPVARWAFEWVAGRMVRREAATAQLRKNLARVVGQEPSEALVTAALKSYARYWAEAFRLPAMPIAQLHAKLEGSVAGVEHLDASLSAGKGVVLTLPHSGNWDMAGVWLVGHAGQFTTVAERLRPEVLYDAFVEFREGLGFEVLAHNGGEHTRSRLGEVLRGGGIVCLLGERDLKGRGVPVTFFGEETTFPIGPAKLAQTTGAALHTVDSFFTNDGWGFSVSPRIEVGDVVAATQQVAYNFEESISRHPQDWHMLQPVWLRDRRALS